MSMQQVHGRRPVHALVVVVAVAALVVALLSGVGTARASAAGAGCHPYPDVTSTNPACSNIAWLKKQEITKPADGLYHPTSSVNRGSMVAFLFRLTHPGKASPKCTSRPFPDVSTGNVFCGYIQWAKSNKIAFGYPNGTYGPGNTVTRGAMAAYLHRIVTGKPAQKCTSKPFIDVKVGETFCGVIVWMANSGITYGVGGGKYGTTLPVTRQAMASFLHRTWNIMYGAVPPTTLDSSTLVKVMQSKHLRVCTTGDYRPFTYLDPATKKWSGIDISMAKDLASHLGAKAVFVQVTWSTLIQDVKNKCDIGMGGISITTERAKQLYISDPTLLDGKTPITLCANVNDYDTISKINNPSVNVITPIGGTNEVFADANFPKANIIKWTNNNTIFDEIVAGHADVMVTDASEAKWVAHKDPQLCAVHPDTPFTFGQQGYLVHQSDSDMLKFVNVWLNIAQHDGTYAAAEQPWFG